MTIGMKKEKVVIIINIIATLNAVLEELGENIGLNVGNYCKVLILVLVTGIAVIILRNKSIKSIGDDTLFLLSTLISSLMIFFAVIGQVVGKNFSFMVLLLCAAVLVFILLKLNNEYLRISENIFVSRVIVTFFLAILAVVYVNVFPSDIIKVIYSLAMFIGIAVGTTLIMGKEGHIVCIVSKMIGILYACIWIAAIIGSIFKQLDVLFVLGTPSISITVIIWIFKKEILKKFKELGSIIFIAFPMTFSLPLAFLFNYYSDDTLYKVFIATLLGISAFILLIISSDNIESVMKDDEKSYLEIKFSKVRMFIGNATLFLTGISVVIDNFYERLKQVDIFDRYDGIIVVFGIWIVGSLISMLFIYVEGYILKKVFEVMKSVDNGDK